MIRRLIRWLAAELLTKAYEAGLAEGRKSSIDRIVTGIEPREVALRVAGARAEAFLEGQEDAFERVTEAVRERMHGAVDCLVTPEDLARAKKGALH